MLQFCLRAIREQKGLSQTEVSRKVGITQPSFANIERGKRRPSVETAKLIGSALDFDWTLFFENKDSADLRA